MVHNTDGRKHSAGDRNQYIRKEHVWSGIRPVFDDHRIARQLGSVLRYQTANVSNQTVHVLFRAIGHGQQIREKISVLFQVDHHHSRHLKQNKIPLLLSKAWFIVKNTYNSVWNDVFTSVYIRNQSIEIRIVVFLTTEWFQILLVIPLDVSKAGRYALKHGLKTGKSNA